MLSLLFSYERARQANMNEQSKPVFTKLTKRFYIKGFPLITLLYEIP